MRAKSLPLSIEIGTDERVALVGKTGSGKTFFARHLTRGIPRLVVCDSKWVLSSWGLAPWTKESRKALREGDPVRIRVVWAERGESTVFWEEVLWEVLEAGDVTLYVDEIAQLAPAGPWAPEVLQRIWTQGRELSVGAIASTQRPRRIPPFLLTEPEHFVMFRLQKKADRAYMTEFMGDAVLDPLPPKDLHGFWYYHNTDLDPIYSPGLVTEHGDGWGSLEAALDEPRSDGRVRR